MVVICAFIFTLEIDLKWCLCIIDPVKCIGSLQNIDKKRLELNRDFSVISSPVCLYEGKYYVYLARRLGDLRLIRLCKIKGLLNDYPTIFKGYKLMNTLKGNCMNAD